jgi:uncharacterized protein (DUF427 family)
MKKSPGHKEMPEHKIKEHRLRKRLKVEIDGELIADSEDVIEVDEDGSPPRYYFPRSDVKMDKLQRSATTTECPFKGVAHYFSVHLPGNDYRDAVWTYEDPYAEHLALKDRLAFYDDKIKQIRIASEA